MAAPAQLSPLAPKTYPVLPPIAGVRFATVAAGVRYAGRTDVMLALFDRPGRGRGRLHPLQMPLGAGRLVPRPSAGRQGAGAHRQFWQRQRLHRRHRRERGRPCRRGRGQGDRREPNEIFMASTGVIGEPLDGARITRVVETLVGEAEGDRLLDAARAIMTTDTYPKVATARVRLGEAEVTINGVAKGAGMIAPDMATMLAYVFTDAPVARARCRRCCRNRSSAPSTRSPSTATPRPPTR